MTATPPEVVPGTSSFHRGSPGLRSLLSYEVEIALSNSLAKSDLSRLSRASRCLLEIFRPHIFREVRLIPRWEFDHSNINETLLCFRHNQYLAQLVKRLVVSLPPKPRNGSRLATNTLKAIMEMTSLNSLEVKKGVLFNSWELQLQEEFVDHLVRRQTPLQYLHFPEEAISQGGGFLINRLIGVTFHRGTPCQATLSMLLASQATLTELRLGVDAPWGDEFNDSWSMLWPLRFPHLRVFSVGVWENLNLSPGLKRFLIGHRNRLKKFEFERHFDCGPSSITFSPTITEELKIKSINGSGDVISMILQGHPDLLGPNLESITLARHCDKMLITQYGRKCVFFRYDVKTENEEDDQVYVSNHDFALDFIIPKNPASVRAQLNILLDIISDDDEQLSALVSNLKTLHIPFEDRTSRYCDSIQNAEFCETMVWCAAVFPSLEVLSGPIPEIKRMTVEELGDVLGEFSSLKTVDFDMQALGGSVERAREAVVVLGEYCRALETINILTSRKTAISMKIARTRQLEGPDALEVCTIAEESTIIIEQKTLSQTTPEVCSCH